MDIKSEFNKFHKGNTLAESAVKSLAVIGPGALVAFVFGALGRGVGAVILTVALILVANAVIAHLAQKKQSSSVDDEAPGVDVSAPEGAEVKGKQVD